jgi:hypothetical protein
MTYSFSFEKLDDGKIKNESRLIKVSIFFYLCPLTEYLQ